MKTELIKTDTLRGGKLKFMFNQMEVSKILLQELGYSYIKLKGNGKYLKAVPGGYEIVPFQNLKNSFTDYLRNSFNVERLPEGLTYEVFMNCYFDSRPVSRNHTSAYFQSKNKLNEIDFEVEKQFLKFK